MKLKAFTLPDLIVGILLSSIVVSAMAVVMVNVSKGTRNFIHQIEMSEKYVLLQNIIYRDMERCDSISNADGSCQLWLGKEVIGYKLNDGFLIRCSNTVSDTLLSGGKFSYQLLSPGSGLIKCLHIRAESDFCFCKDYASSFLLSDYVN